MTQPPHSHYYRGNNTNMELQAILDAPDSDSSSSFPNDAAHEDLLISSFRHGKNQANAGISTGRRTDGRSQRYNDRRADDEDPLDLERILREHDEEDDDDDNDEYYVNPNGLPLSGAAAMSPDARRALNALASHYDDGNSLGGSSISTRTNLFSSYLQQQEQQQDSPSSSSPLSFSLFARTKSQNRDNQLTKSSYYAKGAQGEKLESTSENLANVPPKDDSFVSQGITTTSTVLPRNFQNPQDWAILQRILNEVDNDDDDEDGIHNHDDKDSSNDIGSQKEMKLKTELSKSFPWKELKRTQSNTSSTMDVDAILNSIDSEESEDDDDHDVAELDAMMARFSVHVQKISEESEMKKKSIFTRNKTEIDNNPIASTMSIGSVLCGKNDSGKLVDGVMSVKDTSENNSTAVNGQVLDMKTMTKNVGWSGTRSKSQSISVDRYFQKFSKNQAGLASEVALKQAEEYERQLLKPGQYDIISPLMVKRRMKPKIELQTKSRIQQQQSQQSSQVPSHKKSSSAFSTMQQSPFNFSGMIESKCMQKISYELQRNMENKDVGLPTALCISSKFIAVGTQHGVVLVFDLFEELRQELGVGRGGQNDGESYTLDSYGSVSSIDISSNGENLIAGYTSGTVILWDVIKGTTLKLLRDAHPSPITILRFISEKSLSIVSIDAGGLVNKLTFVKTMLWSNYNVETECLLDGTAGQILAMDVLPSVSSLKTIPMSITETKKKQPYHPSINRLVLLALSSERGSFAIAVEPSVSVLHRWARPSDDLLNVSRFISELNSGSSDRSSSPPSAFLPCLSWCWALVSGGENSVTPILARAWGCCIQLLRASFPHSDESDDSKAEDKMVWPAFGVHDEFEVMAPVMALEWLGDRSLVFLTLTNELMIVDTVMMTLTERLDFAGMKLVFAEFALSRTAHSSTPGNVPCSSTTFQNSIRSSEDRLLVLCQKEVTSISILGIHHRVTALEEDGEWLEALALSLDHYEFTIKSQEDRRRNPDGTKDISNHPEFISRIRLTEDEEWIGDLLLRYVTLAVDNAPESTFDSTKPSKIDLAKSHYQMLAGVCIEFCVVTRRLDLLFNEVYQFFRNTQYTGVFLEVLEPYILSDKLRYVAPSVMSEFIDYHKSLGDISTVERCLLHMDVTIMDFDSILSLLRKNCMFSALIYVYTQGLDDYASPLEIIFDACFDAIDDVKSEGRDNLPSHEDRAFQRYGYKILLFLRHCLLKKTFPTGEKITPEQRVSTMRPELLYVLLRKRYKPLRPTDMPFREKSVRKKLYPYMYLLVKLDPKAFLDTIGILFDDDNVEYNKDGESNDNFEDWENFEVTESELLQRESQYCPHRMEVVRGLACVLSDIHKLRSSSVLPEDALGYFHDFLGKYLLKGVIRVPPTVVCDIISRMSARSMQSEIMNLLQVLPRNAYTREDVLHIVEASHLSRAALILHKGGVKELSENGTDSSACSFHFKHAIDCYLNDKDKHFQHEVFDYIKNECIGGNAAILDNGKNSETTMHDVFRVALCEKLPALIHLDSIRCTQLVAEIFVDELDVIISSLELNSDELVLFKFYHAVISGDLAKVDGVAAQVLLANLTINHHQKYLELMAKFHPDMVYHHLTSSDSYRVEECLKLCQEYEIADASAYLLEKMGNVSSALQLMLQTLEGRLMTLKRVIRGLTLASTTNKGKSRYIRKTFNVQCTLKSLTKGKEFQAVRQILSFGLDLCERNSGPSSNSGHGSQLWFNVLDRLVNAKGFLRLSKELPEHSEIMFNVLSDLLRITMQRMVSSVPLPDLVRKMTTDHTGNRLGELREMITTMLSAFVSEVEVCNTATNAMQYDVQKLSVSLYCRKVNGIRVHGQDLSKGRADASVVCINSRGDASFVQNANLKHSDKENEKYHTTRLRNRRFKKTYGKTRNTGEAKVRRGMLSKMEAMFQMGESSDAAFMSRCIGTLSEAEHFGKLM